jgi:(S)-citramalyl-CoA lyase
MADSTSRPLRSWQFTPATRPDRFDKATSVGADVLIIDLEDAVAPSDKDGARSTALEYLVHPKQGTIARALRINGLETRFGQADLSELFATDAVPDFLILPKTESAAQLRMVDRLLALTNSATLLVALVESAIGLAAVDEIAGGSPRLAGLMFGAADMAADLGAETAWEPLLHVRSAIVAACARHGIIAIDAPFFNVKDSDGLKQEIARSRSLGFAAKAAIHPTQVEFINAALTPTAAAVAEAREILAENAKGVGVVNGQMIDEAVARKARRVLAAAAHKA